MSIRPNIISDAGVAFIKDFEGYRLQSYRDIKGIPTIGVGHTGHDVEMGQTITSDEVDDLLRADLMIVERCIVANVKVDLKQCMFDALCSLVFNIGTGAFSKSTLLKLLNKSKYVECASQFLRWNKSNGTPVPGLTRRREAERALFLKEGVE
jgi:GH24 family phage-related lysozyme (muramidase)